MQMRVSMCASVCLVACLLLIDSVSAARFVTASSASLSQAAFSPSINQAGLRIILSNFTFEGAAAYIDDNCYRCSQQPFPASGNFSSGLPYSRVSTDFGQRYYFYDASSSSALGTFWYHFEELGLYTLKVVSQAEGLLAVLTIDYEPQRSKYWDLYVCVIVMTCLSVFGCFFPFVYERLTRRYSSKGRAEYEADPADADIPDPYGLRNNANNPLLPSTSEHDSRRRGSRRAGSFSEDLLPPLRVSPRPKKERVLSLDTFRGLSVAIMIFVNYGGGGYWFFNHSAWNGLTLADLVFPWFIFMMGASMALSLDPNKDDGSPLQTVWKITKRSAILFFLGLMISNENSTLESLRIFGVLQRFGVSYFVVGLVMMFTSQLEQNQTTCTDVRTHLLEWLVILVIASIHIGITFGLEVPGCGKGCVVFFILLLVSA